METNECHLSTELILEQLICIFHMQVSELIDKQATYPADCRKIAAVDSNKHDSDWQNRRYWNRFLYKNIF